MMERVRTYVLVTIAMLFGGLVGGGVSRFAMSPAQAKDLQRWDYSCFEEWGAADDITAQAKAAGRNGWEMVVGYNRQGRQGICFKRPL